MYVIEISIRKLFELSDIVQVFGNLKQSPRRLVSCVILLTIY